MGDLIPARVKVKTATTAQWATVEDTFIPLKGELIVYSDANDGDPAIKIGDGTTAAKLLPFIGSGGGSQVQADWTEEFSDQPSFIKHKPHTFSMLSQSGDIDYIAITDTAPVIDGGGTVVALYNVPELDSIKQYVDSTFLSSGDDVSELINDAGYITAADVPSNETDPTVPAWAKAVSKPSYTAVEVGALPDTTVIPSTTSDLVNDSGFIIGTDVPSNETDPTVYAWAKAASKPSYTASEVGALPDTTSVPDALAIASNVISLMAGATVLSTITLPVYSGGVS